VAAGDVLLELHTNDDARLPAALEALEGAIVMGEGAPEPAPLVLERIG
jgi:thymidine phosphorylase